MPRRNHRKQSQALIGFRPSREDVAALDYLATMLNTSRSDVLRTALRALAERHIHTPPRPVPVPEGPFDV